MTLLQGLMVAQALALSAAPLMMFAGGVIGARLHNNPSLATLPVAAMIIGTALAVLPAAAIAARFGRRVLFINAMLFGSVASLAAALAIYKETFWGVVASAVCFGGVAAVVQQFRFVAMASVTADKHAVVAARLLLVGIVSAFLGPELVTLAAWFPRLDMSAAFIALALFFTLAAAVLAMVVPRRLVTTESVRATGRSLSELLSQPTLWLATLSASCGFSVMSYIMTATPISMTLVDGYALADAKWVIQSHIAAMFLPSLISGYLIQGLGHVRMIVAGLVSMLLCIAVAWWDRSLLHYWLGLLLLGFAWNLLFVAGTSLLTQCYRPEEATRVQGFNDLLVFGGQALGAMASGAVVLILGWQGLLLSALPPLMILVAVLVWQQVSIKRASAAGL